MINTLFIQKSKNIKNVFIFARVQGDTRYRQGGVLWIFLFLYIFYVLTFNAAFVSFFKGILCCIFVV